MLVARIRAARDEEGLALLTVVVVMLVGFVVAASVAASLLFTITANVGNKGQTQAFVAAESGRDEVRAQIADGCTDAAELHAEGTGPTYVADARYVEASASAQPSSYDDPGLSATCPGDEPGWMVIRSTGQGADGSIITVDSVYPWEVRWEEQAGGVLAYFANGVSLRGTYAGDIVVREGDYTCAAEGTLDGDLYVTRGDATFSRDCTVYGDVWTRDGVDGSAQRINITGNVKTGGVGPSGSTVTANVSFTSNGTVIGTASDPETGAIEATGAINLTNTGSTNGNVWGDMTAGGAITIGDKWVIDPSATQSPATAPPPFDPTLEFIREITAWMDLDRASDWGVPPTPACALTPTDLKALLAGDTSPVLLDYTSCGGSNIDVTLLGGAVNRDAAFLLPPNKVANISLTGNLTGDRQLVFLQEDNSRALVSGETSPSCGNGNQRNNLAIGSGLTLEPRLMVYSPCGLNGTVNSSFRGQLYSNDTSGVTFIGTAEYTCALMTWAPAFEKLGCKVRGEGDDVVLETVLVKELGLLSYQTEYEPTPTPTPGP